MLITLENVSYTYSPGTPFSTLALDDISLEIEKGEFIGIAGHTGCGKSTFIQVISGLLKPDAGSVCLNGQDIYDKKFDKKILRKTIGVVFQYPEYQLFEETVALDVAFGPGKAGYDEEKINECVQWAIEQVGLNYNDVKDLSPFELSGGQKRKVAIAGVLALKPEVLILDEPIAGLDPAGREELMRFVTGLNRQGITIIMISHNMDGLSECASRILVMNEHKIVMDNVPKAIFSDIKMLNEIGIGASEAREIVEMLRNKNKNIPSDIITKDELVSYLIGRLK